MKTRIRETTFGVYDTAGGRGMVSAIGCEDVGLAWRVACSDARRFGRRDGDADATIARVDGVPVFICGGYLVRETVFS